MTATTNGASLEDCLTNIFSLIDLNGIRWKRFKQKENNNYLYTPIDTHPVLTTYAKCIEENHIAVWRQEPQKRHNSSPGQSGHSGGHTGSVGQSNFPTPTRTSNNNTPTGGGPSNLTSGPNSGNQNSNSNSTGQNAHYSNNYELWIFGYGNQLKVDNVIGEDLVEIEDDTWESRGLSYECRTLLFKALHNLIERCLITEGFTKLGRWYVRPSSDNFNHPTTVTAATLHSSNASMYPVPTKPFKQPKLDQNSIISPFSPQNTNSATSSSTPNVTKQNTSLSTTVSSAINRIIETQQELLDHRQSQDKSDGLRHTSNRGSSSYFTTSFRGSKSSLSFAFSFFVHGDSTICTTVDLRQHPLVYPLSCADMTTFQEGKIVRVALAPFGLNGVLNGVSYKDSDSGTATTTFIQQWSKYYPLPKTFDRLVSVNKTTNSAMNNLNQKNSSSGPSQYSQSSDGQLIHGSRSYLSNLTNMLPPPSQKSISYFDCEAHEVPPVVEVIVAGYRMRYPSECVFTTSKVTDLYKSLQASSDPRTNSILTNKRPSKNSPPKPNKLSLLSEDKNETQTKIKVETDQNSTSSLNNPFKLATIDTGDKTNVKSGLSTNQAGKQTTEFDSSRSKSIVANGCLESDPGGGSINQLSMSRLKSSKAGFSTNPIHLAPTDLVKLFPTPPSLEQVVLSPSGMNDEGTHKDTTKSPPSNLSESTRDRGIDIYKPVECALMPPVPKWAALTNVTISSTKSLPPECIYKGSLQGVKSLNPSEIPKASLTKSLSVQRQLNSLVNRSSEQSLPSPLTDQTNKNGFNNLNPDTSIAKTVSLSSNLLGNAVSQANLTHHSEPAFTASTLASSSFTFPHQRLFNNLQEVNSIQLNLMISDSVLGMFKDHNFESCPLCVCSMSIKGSQFDSIPQKIDLSGQWRQSIGSDNLLGVSSYASEFNNDCTCGFSAITNRHCSHLSGLFLEDELEITNVLYDPTEMIDQPKLYRKTRLSNYSENSLNNEINTLLKLNAVSKETLKNSDENPKIVVKQETKSKDEKSSQSNQNVLEETKVFVIDQLKQQSNQIFNPNSSLSRILMIESIRNNRQLTSCSNYYAQSINTNRNGSNGLFQRFLDDSHKYVTVKMLNRNPLSLKFSDYCELTKNIITRLANVTTSNSRLASSLVSKPMGLANLTSIFSRIFNANRQPLINKPYDPHRNNLFIQGLQALMLPTLSVDPKGAIQMLEYLIKEDSKEALISLNKAISIFSSPMHDWQYMTAQIPENNFDAANLLKIIQPFIEQSVGSHNKLYKDFIHQQQQHIFSARDSPTGAPTLPTPPCQGPLTWRQFHQSAGRGTEDQCEPQPIPSLLVGHHVEKNHLAVSPFALKFWDKLLLEPYAPGHNMFYLVITPGNQDVLNPINQFFKELSNTYELLKLGRHCPIGNGLIIANSDGPTESEDSWFSKMDFGEKDPSNAVIAKLRGYAAKMNSSLAKTIVEFIEERQPPNDPHADRFDSSPNPHSGKNIESTNITRVSQQPNPNRMFNHLLNPTTSQGVQNHENLSSSADNQAASEPSNSAIKSQTLLSSTQGNSDDIYYQEEEASKQTGIVIYMIDQFSSPSVSQNLRALSTIGLIKCYSMLMESLPDNIEVITQLQLISLDSIISQSRPILNVPKVDQLKSLSMNVYSRCRKILTNQITAKSLTGFGPAAALENFFKTKKPELSMSKQFTPPYILAPMKDIQTELGEMYGDRRERSSVLFCSYCITEDQRWLIASITNDKGELSETTVISTNIIDRMKRPKASVKKVALRKLMDFIISVMSEWQNPWRLIVGKLGRVGHGELKEWASLMSKRSLTSYSRVLNEMCRQCSMIPQNETVSILSACLVSLEPDSRLRIMPDQFTSDDRQASFNKCPLNTPEDASATHILVFPTSASIQSSHNIVEDPLAGSGLDDDLLNQFPLEDGIDDLSVEENMDDLFSAWDDNPTNVSDHISSHHDTMLSSNNLQMGSGSVTDGANDQNETLQLLQQPLALGYYISTAKIGPIPNWFWSTSPHLRNSCPVFLKSALHIHQPCVQLSDDLLHSGGVQTRKSHQLDSNLTTDVLRYVLEGYNSLSWLALNPKNYDRQSCLPVHMQTLLQLYHLMESFS